MRIKNRTQYDIEELKELIAFATRGINMTGVGMVINNRAYSGMAYSWVPPRSPFRRMKTVKYHVRVSLGGLHFPHSSARYKYRKIRDEEGNESFQYVKQGYGSVKSPIYVTHNMREAIVTIVAHEARHIYQFRNKKSARGRELDAEKFANKRLQEFREYEKGRLNAQQA